LADPEHIEILRRGPRVWNAWREENPSQVPNLDDATLSLGERQLGPINGGPINLRKVSMRRAFLRSATLTEADLEAADMSGADLGQARLDRANLASANLSGALLAYADFNGAVLAGANLCGSNLQHVQNLIQEQINGSVCDAATVLPAHLENPVSKLEVSKKSKGGGSLSSDQGQSTFFSKIV
jgi:uncharacterized protein YjbI with pentapeptide repeats